MQTQADVRPVTRGGVIGLGLGRFVFVGAGVALLLAANCLAAPENPRVAAGKATIRQRGNTTVIRASDRSIIDYSRFDIGRNETVRFIQPRADATVLNRINSARPTVIDGTLKANGRVYLVNPGGILFTENAQVQTRGLVAAAGSISNRDFRAGVDHFTDVRGEVVNHGRIETGSAAVLIGRHVANSGAITASDAGGMVAMIAGEDVTLTRQGDTMAVHVARDVAAPPVTTDKPGVDNSGHVSAPRGRSLMLASDVYSLAARNTGSVRARQISVKSEGAGDVNVSGHLDAAGRGVRGKGGSVEVTGQRVLVQGATIDAGGAAAGGDIRIGGDQLGQGNLRRAEATTVDAESRLLADARRAGDGGTVVVWSDGSTRFHGQASASGAGRAGDGGFVETSGHALDIRGGKVRAKASGGSDGKWLLDPFDVTINASDGMPSGSPPMLDPFTPVADTVIDADDIAAALATTPVEITTGGAGMGAPGNITVASDGAINYAGSSAATLTLRAANDIVVNAPIATTGGVLTVNLRANDSGGGNVDPDTTSGSVIFNFGAGDTGGITSSNGAVTISGVDVNIAAGSIIDSGAGDIRITANSTADQDIGLGAGAAGALTLTDTELGQLTSTGRVIIDSPTGDAVASDVAITTLGLGATTYNLTVAGETLTADSVTLSADRELDLTARTGTLSVTGALTAPGMAGSVILTADDVDIGAAAAVNAGDGGIAIQPADLARPVRLGTPDAGALSLDGDELRRLATAGTVTIGRDMGTGAVTISDAAPLDLSMVPYSLTLRGGDITFVQTLNLGGMASTDRQLSLIGDDIGSPLAAGIPAFVVAGTNGRAQIDATGDVTITGSVDQLAARLTTDGKNIDYLNINSPLEIVTLGAVEGVRTAADGDITIRSGDSVTISSGIVTSGSGEVIVNATVPVADVIDNTGAMGVAITVGPGGSIALDAAGGRVGGAAMGDPFKIDTGAAATGMSARLVADTGAGISIVNSGTGELRAGPLSAADGSISLRHGGALLISDRVVAGGTGDVSLRADGNITINAAAMMPTVSAATGDIAITSDSGLIDVNGEIRTVTDGNISLTAATNLSIDDMVEAAMGDISFIADGTVGVNDIVKTNPGDITVSAAELTIGNVGQLNAMNMGGAGGDVTISRKTEGVIDVGEPGSTSIPAMTSVLHIDNAELDRITASSLTIGDADNTRLIRVNGVIEPGDSGMPEAMRAHDSIGAVTLRAERATGAIVFEGSSPSYFTSLDARAAAGIRVIQNITATTGALTLDADSNATDVPSGDVMNVLGIATDRTDVLHIDGARTLTTLGMPTTTDITLRGRRSTGMNTVTGIFADSNLTVDSTHDISIRDTFDIAQTLTLDADNQVRIDAGGTGRNLDVRAQEGVTFTGNVSVGGTGGGGGGGALAVNADSDGDGGVFSLMLDSMSRGTLTLGSGSTARITASDLMLQGNIAGAGSDLQIGRSSSGDIRVGDFTDAAGFLTITNAELSRIDCRDLTIGNFVSSTPAPSVTNSNTNAITVNGVGATDSDGITGTFRLVAGTDLTFATAGSTFGALDGQAVGNVLVSAGAPLTTVTGAMRLAADQATITGTAPDAMGTLQIDAPIATGGNNFTGEGADFLLAAALSTAGSSGRGDVSLTRPSGGTITIDNSPTPSASRMSISDAELRLISAQNITIGDNARVATVNVRNLSDADTAGIAGQFRVQSDNEIFFSGANRVGELAAAADQRIEVLGDITTTRGSLRLDANADNDANATNTIEITGTRTLDSAQDIELTVSGGIIAAETGDLTLRADRNISIFDDLNVSGNLTMLADDQPVSDGQGAITFFSSTVEGTDVLVRNGNAVLDGVAITMEADSSLIAALGTVTLTADDAISVAGNITSNGLLTIHAGQDDAATGDNDGAFTVTGARFLRANNEGDISIRAASASIDPSANLVAQRDVLVTRSSVGRIGIGDGLSDTSGLVLGAAEVGTITARDLVIGDAVNSTAGDEIISRIDVGTLNSADLSTVSGALRLNALGQAGDAGVVEFNATSGQQYGSLDARARTRVRTRGDITAVRGGITLDGNATTPGNDNDGAVVLGGDVLTTSAAGTSADVLISGAVELRRDVTITAQRDAKFNGAIRSPNRRNLLTVNAPREILFDGDIGRPGAARLYGLSINPRLTAQATRPNAVTRLGGNVYTGDENRTRAGAGIHFRDRVVITRNVTIDDNGANGVFFHERVTPGSAGQQSLSVAVRRNGASPVRYADVAQIPRIVFGGDVGNRDLPFRTISLNVPSEADAATNGHTNPQALPTIVASRFGTGTSEDALAPTPVGPGPEFDLVAVESFSMGRNEKLTALGSVDIQVLGSGGLATVGDITALTDIDVRAPRVNIRGRQPGPRFDDTSIPGQRLALDAGTDFVAGGAIRFSTAPTVIEPGPSAPTFGSPNPRASGSNLDAFVYRTFQSATPFSNALTTTTGSGATAQTFVVDLSPNGPSDTNYIDSIAGAIPRESRLNDVAQDPIVSDALFDSLNQLGVNPRNLSGDELQAGLVGWSTYNDYPVDPLLLGGGTPPGVSTTVNRLPGTPTARTVEKFNALFFPEGVNPATGQPFGDQRPVIKAAFDDAVRQYRATHGGTGRIDPRALRAFVDANAPAARDYADRLGEILDDLRLLGLVGRELDIARQSLLRNVRPSVAGWTYDDTERFIHLPVDEREGEPDA